MHRPLAPLAAAGILLSAFVPTAEGWRPRSPSWRRTPLAAISSRNDGRADLLQPQNPFGVIDASDGRHRRLLASIAAASLRGGGGDDDVQSDLEGEAEGSTATAQMDTPHSNKGKSKEKDSDDERYSRQMYALGARAHQLVRSTTAILDGPLGGARDVRIDGADGFAGLDADPRAASRSETPSGLMYELAKNLALSGVGRVILVRDDEEGPSDEGYFDGSLDDLGAAYHRAALAEIGEHRGLDKRESDGEEGDSDITDADPLAPLDDGAILLAEYIQRLNPGVMVDIVDRERLLHLLQNEEEGDEDMDDEDSVSLGTNPVVVCVDRSTTAQLEMNDACRSRECSSSKATLVPFLSVETAGVHAKIFCDFGPNFVVVDENGETPRATLLDRVEAIENEGDAPEEGDKQYTVHCLEDERHDVSKGDVIEFQGEHHDGHGVIESFPKCQVVSVKSPTRFVVKTWDGDSTDQSDDFALLLEGKARSFSRVKLPRQVSFSSLHEILQPASEKEKALACCENDALFAPSDLDKSFDPLRRRAVMTSMAALDSFVKKYERLPSRHSKPGGEHKRTDMERFHSLVQKMATGEDTKQEQWEAITTQFAQTCRAKFTPVQALSGALGAQEVLKAATGLYNPVRQFLLYDCDEVLQDTSSCEAGQEENVEGATGQAYILGDALSNKIAQSRLFLVGAGAIGCELLKNLAAMGAGTGVSSTKQGCLILTDMDTIEKSNLSRQLLFRDHDVGEFKSVAARAAMMRFSKDCNVEAHTSRVGEEEDGPFDDDFWSSGCDVVLNALDNVEARLFVDNQCVAHGLGLIDAGTLGPKGNVQVVVPHESESYGSSADPPEPDIPVCTLKNFPYEISHTIQWARDLFDGYFHRRPRQANDHVEEMAQSEDLTSFSETLLEKLGDDAALDMAEELGEDLGYFPTWADSSTVPSDASDPEYVRAVKRDALNWAILQAHRLFYVAMDELIQKHPADSVDDDGAPFWSGTRRVPKVLRYIPLDSEEDEVSAQQVLINERIAQFVRSAARLRMETFLPIDVESETSLISLEESLAALDEQSRLLYKKKKSKEILHNLSGGGSEEDTNTLSRVVEKLNGANIGASLLPELNLADFEKDDESNGHVAFVTAASNLRAMAYGIPPADAMETRRVAGRIVPAMITTTGLVSALSCLELVKLLKGLPLNMHRNAFVNLALPFFAFTAPMPAEEVEGVNGKTHTIWDRITIKDSAKSPIEALTLSKLLKKLQKKAGFGDEVEVSSISYGPYMLYANFLHSQDEELLETPVMATVKDAVISGDEDEDDASLFEEDAAEEGNKAPVDLTNEQKAMLSKLEQKRFIDLSVSVEDLETGEEFELPPVRLMAEKPQQDEEDVAQ